MFNQDNLHALFAPNKSHPFKVLAYDATGNRAEAEAARNQVGFFPNSAVEPGDVIYVRGNGVTSHHFVTMNEAEGKLALCLMGG